MASFNDPSRSCLTDSDADSQVWASFFKCWVTFLVLFPVWLAGVLSFGNALSGGDAQKGVRLTAASLFGMIAIIGLKLYSDDLTPWYLFIFQATWEIYPALIVMTAFEHVLNDRTTSKNILDNDPSEEELLVGSIGGR